jgi:uncharacterized protein
MPVTVSDSSTLIHLAGIGRLDLLRRFYGEVLVPGAVFREVVTEGGERPAACLVAQAITDGWILVVAEAKDLPLSEALQRDGRLHPGESEAIALLLERDATGLLLMDEAHGRSIARQHGLALTGILGVLLRAKREGLIASLRAELEQLRDGCGFYIHEQLIRQALSLAGEE